MSTNTLPNSICLTTPDTISPILSLNSSYWRPFSASRTRAVIICFAVWKAIRPNSGSGNGSSTTSPTDGFFAYFFAPATVNMVLASYSSPMDSGDSMTVNNRFTWMAPFLRSIFATILNSSPYLCLAIFAIAASNDSITISRSICFSWASESMAINKSWRGIDSKDILYLLRY